MIANKGNLLYEEGIIPENFIEVVNNYSLSFERITTVEGFYDSNIKEFLAISPEGFNCFGVRVGDCTDGNIKPQLFITASEHYGAIYCNEEKGGAEIHAVTETFLQEYKVYPTFESSAIRSIYRGYDYHHGKIEQPLLN
ncbi:MAG: hypothetical protein ACOCQR_02475 [bacterium]